MTNRAEELTAQLEAEIAELEAQAGDGTSGNKYRAELYDEVWQAARDMGYGNVTGALQDLAALKAQQPSAGVVVGALVSALEGIVHDERVPNEVSQDCAALLIEARRLNPCRAQAVPDDEELKVLRAFYRCCASITEQLADSPKSALARLVEAVKDAAPSAQQKESE